MIPKPPTVTEIDRACRDGLFVFYGNRQGILEAVNQGHNMMPFKNKCWIHRESDQAWELVELSAITITSEQMKGTKMAPKGKGRDGAPSHVGGKGVKRRPSSKAAIANAGNLELPGVESDQRRIKDIEVAEEARQAASAAISDANTAYEEAEKVVIKAMHKHGYDPDNNPTYSRPPWGSVVMTKSGEVKEKVKFVAAAKKPKKKKNADDSDSAE